MSARSFRPVMSVATVAFAALGCYLVSMRVAAERAGLEDVENKIVLAQRDIRTLQTEIGTRGRLEQLERWNVKVLALSAPKADQFVDGGYQLARLARPSDEVDLDAPVVLAAARKPSPAPAIPDDDADVAPAVQRPAPAVQHSDPAPRPVSRNNGPASMMHVASYSVPAKPSTAKTPSTTKTPEAKPLAANAAAKTDSVKTAPAKSATVKIASASKSTALPTAKHDVKAVPHSATTKATKDEATH